MVCSVVQSDFVWYTLKFFFNFFFQLEEFFLSLTELRGYEWNYMGTRLIFW